MSEITKSKVHGVHTSTHIGDSLSRHRQDNAQYTRVQLMQREIQFVVCFLTFENGGRWPVIGGRNRRRRRRRRRCW